MKEVEKKSGVEKYLFIGFIIVLLAVILVDTRFTGYQSYQTMDPPDPMMGPGGYYYPPPSAPMPSNDWAPYSYGSPQMPDMTPPYPTTPMPPEMTYGSPQAPNMQAPTGMPEGPKCNEGEVFTTFPYYPDKNSFIYTRPDGEEIRVSEFEAYTKCTKMKQKIGPCSLGDEWREGQWGTGCYPIPGVISDHTQPTYEGWESADCCAPKEKVECPIMPDPNNPLEPVQWEACNPGAEDYSGLACCNTKQGYECVGDIGNKKCMEKLEDCRESCMGKGAERGYCYSYNAEMSIEDTEKDFTENMVYKRLKLVQASKLGIIETKDCPHYATQNKKSECFCVMSLGWESCKEDASLGAVILQHGILQEIYYNSCDGAKVGYDAYYCEKVGNNLFKQRANYVLCDFEKIYTACVDTRDNYIKAMCVPK